MNLKKIFLNSGILLLTVFTISSCSILKQSNELFTFTKCNFTVDNVKIVNIAGVDVSNLKSIDDLSLTEYLQLAKQAFSKDVPSKLRIKIKAFNPTDNRAYISGLDWQLFFKEDLYSDGAVNNAVEVMPHKNNTFDVITNVNLTKIIKSESFPELIKTILDQSKGIDLSKIDATIKLKPWYYSGSTIKKYPGYINIHP